MNFPIVSILFVIGCCQLLFRWFMLGGYPDELFFQRSAWVRFQVWFWAFLGAATLLSVFGETGIVGAALVLQAAASFLIAHRFWRALRRPAGNG